MDTLSKLIKAGRLKVAQRLEGEAGSDKATPENRGRINFSSNKVNWEKVNDDLRNITELRDLLASLENIEQVASKLILDNPRFWVELDYRPGDSQFWNSSEDYSSSSVDSWYLQSLNAELHEDEKKATSLKKLVEFDNDAYKTITASIFEQLAQDPITAQTSTIEQDENEGAMPQFELVDRLSMDFGAWTKRIYQLCLLKDEVFAHYVLPEESSYPFSLLPLEKFRYFYRELATICRLQESLKLWMERQTPETVAVLSCAKWLQSLTPFIDAVKLLAAISMQFSVIFLTIKNSLEEAQKIKKELVPSLGIQLIEYQKLELTIEELEGVIAQETEKLSAAQETIASLQQQQQEILQKIEFARQQRIAPQQALMAKMADTSDEKQNDLLRETLYTHIAVTEASVQAIESWEKDLKKTIPSKDIATCHKQIEEYQKIIAHYQDKIAFINLSEENKRKKAARDALHQQAVNNAEETWAKCYDKAVSYLTTYMQHAELASVLPAFLECPASDIMLLRAVSQQDELDKFILKEMQVDEVKQLTLKSSAGTVIYADASEQQFSHLLVSTESSQSSAVGRDILEDLEDISQKILDSYRAESGADQQILQQLESVLATEVVEKMQDSPQERESMFSFVVRKPSNSVVTRQKVLSPSEELALHRMMRTTTEDQRLAQIMDECYVGYNLCATSATIQEWLKIQYQRLYLRFFETTLSEEIPFFNSKQLEQLTVNNWMLSLCHVIETLTAKCDSEDLAQQRVISIVKVLHKMIEHAESLPAWVDGDIFEKIDNSDDKNYAKQLTEVVKVKLAFSLVLELLCEVLNQSEHKTEAAFLVEMQDNFKLKFSIEDTKKTDVIALAIYFLSLHQTELLQGTNFSMTDSFSKQSSRTEKDIKETSTWSQLRNLAAKATGLDLKNKDISQAKIIAEPVYVEVNDRFINLVVAELKVILLFVNNEAIFMENIVGIDNSVQDKEQLLGEVFLEKRAKIEKHTFEDEDGYRKALEAAQKRRATGDFAVVGSVAGVTNGAALWPDLYQAMEMSSVVSVVLCSLVLENPALNMLIKEDTVMASSFDILKWVKKINALCDARANAVREIENRLNGVTEAEEASLGQFIFTFKQLKLFLHSVGLQEFLQQQTKSSLNKLVQSVQRLNAIVMMLCIITLAVKREQGQAQEMMSLLPASEKIHRQSVVGEDSVAAAWSAYTLGIKFFSAYLANTKNIPTIKLDNISVLLPFVKTDLMQQWIEQFPEITGDTMFIEYFQGMLQLQPRSMFVILGSGEYGAIISLQPTVKPSMYVLQVNPERLHPEFTIARAALNVKGRAPYSLLKVADNYDKKVGMEASGDIKMETLCKGFGAISERDQLQLAYGIICSNRREDSFALQGFLGLLYFVTIQRTVLKAPVGSRMAQSLAKFAENELGIDLQQFKEIFNRWVRSRGFKSSEGAQHIISEHKRDIFVVNLALTMAVGCLQSAETAVLTNHQLQFAIRANGYLTVLHIHAFIENLEMYKGFHQTPETIFCILNEFIQQCGDLSRLMQSYLDENSSSTLSGNASQVSGYQCIKLAFIFVLVMYKEIFATLKNIGAHGSQYENFEDLFTHILREYFLRDTAHDGLAYSLAFEFFETKDFFKENTLVALGAPVENPSCFKRTLQDSSTITATTRGFALLGPVRNPATRTVLLQQGVSSFFAATQVDPEEAVLLMAAINSHSSASVIKKI